MRCLEKKGEQWEMERLEEPHEISAWMWKHDGAEAVVVQDKPKKIYYCATEALKTEYAEQGKKAAMFWDLELELRKKMKPAAPSPSADNPYWCATYSIVCSEREECREDCCYKPIGGMREWK